jgi:OTU domain-containing protein 6
MGRLPKGFKKTLAHKHDGPEAADGDEEVQKPQAGKEKASAATASTSNEPSSGKHAPAPDLPPANGGDDGSGSDEEGSQGGPETKGRMLQRHKKARIHLPANFRAGGLWHSM